MNGSGGAGAGASPENRGYAGGIPGQVPPMGLMGHPGLGGLHGPAAAAAAAGLSGPELKHHADFLSRLLAATPSYMSEMGNPPPGFFSDWLRRLVSKPSGNTSQSSGLTFAGGGGSGSGQPEGESSGRSRAPSTTPSLDAQISSKRRKRSRLNDHPEHPLGVTILSTFLCPSHQAELIPLLLLFELLCPPTFLACDFSYKTYSILSTTHNQDI
jgi:hypothetical protein